jgi:DNA-binding NarL/FixJ family response regulator
VDEGVAAVRVILADDSNLFRRGLAGLLAASGIEVAAEVADGPALLEALERVPADAVILDIRMPPTFQDEGLVLAVRLRRSHPGLGVLLLSTHVELAWAKRLVSTGAGRLGYLLKDRVADVVALRDALVRVLDGEVVLDPEIVHALLARSTGSGALVALNSRERDVLRAMAEGRSNAGIAAALHLSERTVENYVARIFTKLDLAQTLDRNRRVQAVLLWLEHAGDDAPSRAAS